MKRQEMRATRVNPGLIKEGQKEHRPARGGIEKRRYADFSLERGGRGKIFVAKGGQDCAFRSFY
jgi:hypothetical protein